MAGYAISEEPGSRNKHQQHCRTTKKLVCLLTQAKRAPHTTQGGKVPGCTSRSAIAFPLRIPPNPSSHKDPFRGPTSMESLNALHFGGTASPRTTDASYLNSLRSRPIREEP